MAEDLRLANLYGKEIKAYTNVMSLENKGVFCYYSRKNNTILHNMYFADPYCAWQKGTNENLNGLIREFYPKRRNLERVNEKTLKKNLALINAKPNKVLHFQKPIDLFNKYLAKCCT